MADVTNLAIGATTVGANYLKTVIAQSDVGREHIISLSKGGGITDADVQAVLAQLTLAGGDGSGSDQNGPDAFTVNAVATADGSAFVSGTTTALWVKAQGTGTPNLGAVSGVTLATVAIFTPAK